MQRSGQFGRDGYAVLNAYDALTFHRIESFAVTWLQSLLAAYVPNLNVGKIATYHRWCDALPAEHRQILQAAKRHKVLPEDLKALIVNSEVREFLSAAGYQEQKLWDEGLGDIAFRLIRPGRGDGYPFTAKSWGPAKGVASIYIPIVGFSEKETLLLARGSHLKSHEQVDRAAEKFAREPRYAGDPAQLDLIRPRLEKGQIMIFHPLTLHSEEIDPAATESRFSLELRVCPDAPEN